jgi:hypothetical protein
MGKRLKPIYFGLLSVIVSWSVPFAVTQAESRSLHAAVCKLLGSHPS